MPDKKLEELSEDELGDVTGGLGNHEVQWLKGKGAAAKSGSKPRPSDKWIADGGDTKI